ncbi:CHAT domain-containing protein [Streptomyces sp. NPDC058739]|uniref:CHAT domain-containing protein n=1 Tax=Streptomyces sp. NPDC058739 TaxID=3346618 RepID=UPI0036C779FC
MTTTLELQIGRLHSGEYEVRVVRSAAGGEAQGPLSLDVEELLGRRSTLQDQLLASAAAPRRIVPANEQDVQQVGRQLFDALFDGPVSGTYRASLGVARERQDRLQIVLRLDSPELTLLPWETLFDPQLDTYVCRQEPMIRHVPATHTPDPLPVEPPLRILGVIASPHTLPPLNTDAEKERLEKALAAQVAAGWVELVWLTDAGWDTMHTRLMDGPWHVVHFIGHSGYDDEAGEGALALVGEGGGTDMVEASRLADLLGEAVPAPRLVVLNSCASAQGGRKGRFSSMGAALVEREISAVAAMQFAVTDQASVRFAQGFYTALAHGRRVDDAVRSGRISMLGASQSLEWITPVLYVRGEANLLFSMPKSPKPRPAQPPKDARCSAQAKTLYVNARAELRIGNPDKAVALLDDLLSLNPNHTQAILLRTQAAEMAILLGLYEEAVEAEKARQWPEAIESYEQILEKNPEYEDALARRDRCRDLEHIEDLQDELRHHAETQRWRIVLEVSEELAQIDPTTADPDGLTSRARQEIAQTEQTAQLKALYTSAHAAEQSKNWASAINSYEKILGVDPQYRDAPSRRDHCRDRKRIDDLHNKLRHHAEEQRWQSVLDMNEELNQIDPTTTDPDGLATRARRELARAAKAAQLESLYTGAHEAEQTEDWATAIDCYEQILQRDPRYRDARARRDHCLHRKHIANLQNNLRRDAEAQRWQSVLEVSEELYRLDPDAHDPNGLATQARHEIALAAQVAQLEDLYTSAYSAEQSEDWATAIDCYEQILQKDPQYRDARSRRDHCLDRQRITQLQGELRYQAQTQQWQSVIEVSEELHRIDPATDDPDGLTTRARQELAQATHVSQLDLYTRARAAEKSEDWATAIACYDDLARLADGEYRDSTQRRRMCLERLYRDERVSDGHHESPAYARVSREIDAPCGCLAWASSGWSIAVNLLDDPRIRVYDMAGDEQLSIKTSNKWAPYVLGFSPDGTRLVSQGRKGATVWDAETGESVLHVTLLQRVTAAAFSRDGGRIATGTYDTAYVWDAETAEELFRTEQHAVKAMTFSPDGNRLVIADRLGLHAWNLSTELKTFEDRRSSLESIAYSPDSKRFAAGSRDGTALLWTSGEVEELVHEGPVTSVAFNANGTRLATGSEDGAARIWDTSDGQLICRMVHDEPVNSVAFSPYGTRLAVGTKTDVTLWTFQ